MTELPSPVKGHLSRDILLLIFVCALVLFPSFPMRELWTPDEPRYMEVAREMVVLNDYLVPHLNGVEYPEKPPIFFWLTAGFYKLGFGYNSGRLTSALAALGTVLLTYLLAQNLMPSPGPIISALAALTVVLFLDSKSGYINSLLMFFITVAVFLGHAALQPQTKRRTLCWLGCYACCAFGVLTKGPLAFIALGVLLPYAMLNRNRIRFGLAGHVIGLLLFLAIVSAWLLPALAAGGDAYRNHLLGNTVAGTPSHHQPFFYYMVLYPLHFMPWMFLLPLAAVAAVRQWRRNRDDGALLAVAWFVLVFVLFSALPGKRRGYLTPLIPAAGLLIGYYVSLLARGGFPWPYWSKVLSYITFAGFILAGAGAPICLFLLRHAGKMKSGGGSSGDEGDILSLFTPDMFVVGLITGLLVAAFAIVGIVAVRRQSHARAAGMIVAIMLAISLATDLFATPRGNRVVSPKPFCEAAKPYLAAADKIHLVYNDLSGVYNLYTGIISMPVLRDTDKIKKALAASGKVAMISEQRPRLELLGQDALGYPIVIQKRVGSRTIELILNWDPKTGQHIVPGPPSP